MKCSKNGENCEKNNRITLKTVCQVLKQRKGTLSKFFAGIEPRLSCPAKVVSIF